MGFLQRRASSWRNARGGTHPWCRRSAALRSRWRYAADGGRGAHGGRSEVEEQSGTRTGRWRRALRGQSTLSLEERLYRVIRSDIEAGTLPAGALMPSSERVAQEIALQETDVQSALTRLLVEGLRAVRYGGHICTASQGQTSTVGDDGMIYLKQAVGTLAAPLQGDATPYCRLVSLTVCQRQQHTVST